MQHLAIHKYPQVIYSVRGKHAICIIKVCNKYCCLTGYSGGFGGQLQFITFAASL